MSKKRHAACSKQALLGIGPNTQPATTVLLIVQTTALNRQTEEP